jgi:hypothetical protein
MSSNPPLVIHFARKMRGRSQSVFVLADDGNSYVLKFQNNPDEKDALFCEAIGTEIFRACGLPAPSWEVLRVSSDLLEESQNCWIDAANEQIAPTHGFCFGSRFIGSYGARLYDLLPSSSYSRTVDRQHFWLALLIDVCSTSSKIRKATFVRLADQQFRAVFVGHGRMFGQPLLDPFSRVMACRYHDRRIYPVLSPEYLSFMRRIVLDLCADHILQVVTQLPEEWKTGAAMDGLERALDNLTSQHTVDRVLEDILEAIEIDKVTANRDLSNDSRLSLQAATHSNQSADNLPQRASA